MSKAVLCKVAEYFFNFHEELILMYNEELFGEDTIGSIKNCLREQFSCKR